MTDITALAQSRLDFTQPLETESGEPVKYVCHDVIEYKCARVCVDVETGIVYSSPHVGLKIRNVSKYTAVRKFTEEADLAYHEHEQGWISDMKCGDRSHQYLSFVRDPKNILALVEALEMVQRRITEVEREKDGFESLAMALRDDMRAATEYRERALALLNSANTENVWEIIGRLKTVISGDYRSDAECGVAVELAPDRAVESEIPNYDGAEFYRAGWNARGKADRDALAAVVDILLQQLDDAVQGRNTQPAPVVPEDCGFKDSYIDGWNACRAAMLNGGNSEQMEPVS